MERQDSIWKGLFVLFAVFSQLGVVKADAGDVIAGLLGGFMLLIAICAGLGWYSRRGTASSSSSGGSESTTAESHT